MSAKAVRVAAMVVFFGVGIPGMIVSSINDNTGAGVTFGIIGAVAAIVLLAVTTVTTGRLSPHDDVAGGPHLGCRRGRRGRGGGARGPDHGPGGGRGR